MSKNSITYIGNATTLILLDGLTILTDPWFIEYFLFLKRRKLPVINHPQIYSPHIVTITHGHPDHFCRKSLALIKKEAIVIAPANLSKKLRSFNFREIKPLNVGERITLDSIEIIAVKTPHKLARCLGYIFRGSKTVYFPGDLAPPISQYKRLLKDLPPVDCAVLPAGGFSRGPSFLRNHLSVEELGKFSEILRPKIVVPIHWGHNPLFLGREVYEGTGEKLKEILSSVDPSITTRVLEEGETCEIL